MPQLTALAAPWRLMHQSVVCLSVGLSSPDTQTQSLQGPAV